MGSVQAAAAELSLDIRPPSAPSPSLSPPTFLPKTITDFLCDLSTLPPPPDKLSRLNEFLARLEDEFSKIHAFKRELPLSMLLLNDAIVALKEESEKCRAHKSQPVLEEFIPLKKEFDQSEEEEEHRHHNRNKDKECRDNNKKTWMSSVQLWNTPTINNNNAYDHKQQQQQQHHHHHKLLEYKTKKNEEQGQSVGEELFQSCRNRGGGGGGRGFMPFSTAIYSPLPLTTVPLASAAPTTTKEEKEDSVFNSKLSLLTPSPSVKSFLREGSGSSGSRSSSNRAVSSSSPPTAQPILRTTTAPPLQPHHQTARKQRRCWSPELHRRFVNALQKLGGSQVATPKQIRELMQVDGLTNDEVKSHLQKYRLHTRRVPSASANQSGVVLGGLWMSQSQQDQYNDSSKGSSSGSGSPQSPLLLITGSRGGTSPTEGDSMEDDEDAKSESYSWKSHTHKQPEKVDV